MGRGRLRDARENVVDGPYRRWLLYVRERIGTRAWNKLQKLPSGQVDAYLEKRGLVFADDSQGTLRKVDSPEFLAQAEAAGRRRQDKRWAKA